MPVSAPPTGTAKRPPPIPRPAPVERVSSPLIDSLGPRPDVAGFWRSLPGTPVIEPDPAGSADHAVVTFLWRGSDATRAVLVLPNKVADPRALERNLMGRAPGTDIWHWSVRMRRDWRATYTLCVDEGQGAAGLDGAEHRAWLRGQGRRDPLNPRSFPPRWGGEPVSVVELPDAPAQSDWLPRPGVPAGTVSAHTFASGVLGNERRVRAYAPPGEGHRDLPVLVLFDGEMWQPNLGVATLLDNLIADGRIPPLVALFPESLGSDARWAELTCNDDFVGFLADELLPWAGARWPLTADPARTVLAGQSLGGLMAAHAAVRAPHRFGNALAQSGSFWWPNGPDAEWLTRVIATAEKEKHPVRFHLSAGEQEWVLLPANRRLRDALRAGGHDVRYREFNGGHDYLCWRTELAEGLMHLLGT
ncbi:enterochelin esterase [Streptomyces sp. NPDC050617]|uniref:enterochelin esterase n=1 Tax=Streptomyces sp. NPDC050617 TaxID=3154628 RepID=UPI00343678BE